MLSRRLGLACAVAVALIGAIVTTGAATPVSAADPLGGGGEYHPLTPQRIFDSRPVPASLNDVAPLGAKPMSPATPSFNLRILGLGGVPASPDQVLGVVVNITVIDPAASGYLTAYGKGAAAGTSSIINFLAGQTVSNLAIVRPGLDGELSVGLNASSGTAQVVVDVFGWFSTSTVAAGGEGARLIPTSPGRILDTRGAVNRTPAGTPLAPRESIRLPIRGVDAVNPTVIDVVPDSSSVVGVVLNLTGISRGQTFLSVLPEDLPPGTDPSTSNVNLAANSVKANLVIVPVGADGRIRIFNYGGSTDVIADVVGYLQVSGDPASRAGRVVPLATPYRTFDTRDPQWGGVTLGPGQAEDWSFAAFANSVAIGGVWVGNQLGVIGNLTNASLARQYPTVPVSSYLTAWPLGAPRPGSSNLNSVEGSAVPNLAVLTYGNPNTVSIYNAAGYAHYLFDASAVILAN